MNSEEYLDAVFRPVPSYVWKRQTLFVKKLSVTLKQIIKEIFCRHRYYIIGQYIDGLGGWGERDMTVFKCTHCDQIIDFDSEWVSQFMEAQEGE